MSRTRKKVCQKVEVQRIDKNGREGKNEWDDILR